MNAIENALKMELRDPEYSEGYAESFLNSFIATQIKVIREQRGMTQSELATAVGTTQAGISRIENVNYSSWSVRTLIKLSRAFGLRLKISFEPHGTLPGEVARFNRNELERVQREEDPGLWQLEADPESRIVDMGWWKSTQSDSHLKTIEHPSEKKRPQKHNPSFWFPRMTFAKIGRRGVSVEIKRYDFIDGCAGACDCRNGPCEDGFYVEYDAYAAAVLERDEQIAAKNELLKIMGDVIETVAPMLEVKGLKGAAGKCLSVVDAYRSHLHTEAKG